MRALYATPILLAACSPTEIDPTEVRFVVDGPIDEVGLMLADGGRVERFSPPASVRVLGSMVTVVLDPLDDGYWATLSRGGRNIGRYATFRVLLFDDRDGDGIHSTQEAFVGAGPEMVFATTVYGDARLERLVGFPNGWSASGHPLQAIPATVHTPSSEASLRGDWGGDSAARVALVPETWWDDDTVPLPFDGTVAGPWTLSQTGEPPTSHLIHHGFYVPDGSAVYTPVRYRDDDGTNSFTRDDAILGAASDCRQQYNHRVLLVWVPRTLETSQAKRFGGRSGWNVGLANTSHWVHLPGPHHHGVTLTDCPE